MCYQEIEQVDVDAFRATWSLVINIMTFLGHDMTLLTCDMTLCGNINKHKTSCHDKKVITP